MIPAKNEAASLPWVLRRLPDAIDEVVLVDGCSTDGTVEVARAARPELVVVHDEGVGKGRALRAGFAAARGEIVVMLDADGSMDPREIEEAIGPLRRGYDLVKGSRYLESGGSDDLSPVRDAGNRVFRALFNLLYGERFTDLCYGFCALRRSRLEELDLRADGFEIETEILARASRLGLAIHEIPSYEAPRRYGRSNLRAVRDGLRVLRTLLGERLAPARRPFASTPATELELSPTPLRERT